MKSNSAVVEASEKIETFCFKEAWRFASTGLKLVRIENWARCLSQNIAQPKFTFSLVVEDPSIVYPKDHANNCADYLWFKLRVTFPFADAFVFRDEKGVYDIPVKTGPVAIYRRLDLKSLPQIDQFFGIRLGEPENIPPLDCTINFKKGAEND